MVHRTRFNDQSPAFMGWRRDIRGDGFSDPRRTAYHQLADGGSDSERPGLGRRAAPRGSVTFNGRFRPVTAVGVDHVRLGFAARGRHPSRRQCGTNAISSHGVIDRRASAVLRPISRFRHRNSTNASRCSSTCRTETTMPLPYESALPRVGQRVSPSRRCCSFP